jgi:hypothetical protein
MEVKIVYDMILGVALTGGLTEVIKRAANISSRLVPLIALVIGIVLSWLGLGWSLSNVLFGIVVGLTSSGLYSGAKASLGDRWIRVSGK